MSLNISSSAFFGASQALSPTFLCLISGLRYVLARACHPFFMLHSMTHRASDMPLRPPISFEDDVYKRREQPHIKFLLLSFVCFPPRGPLKRFLLWSHHIVVSLESTRQRTWRTMCVRNRRLPSLTHKPLHILCIQWHFKHLIKMLLEKTFGWNELH